MRPRAAPGEPVGVYPVAGEGGLERIDALAVQPGVELVASPRRASVLLVAGKIPERLFGAVRRLHDQLPHPRASLCWDTPAVPLADTDHVASDGSGRTPQAVRDRLQSLQDDLQSGRRATSAALLPDQPPAPWQGRGDHGQGGEGMMGGKPYGRPMAMPDDDLRDGLRLDAYRVTVGPFAPMFPAGLELRLTLQGDVIQHVELGHPPFADASTEEPFRNALRQPVTLAELEQRRAAHHLRCLARVLFLRGLRALALRCLRAAYGAAAGRAVNVAGVRRAVTWSGLLLGIDPGLGRLAAEDAACLRGPARRAAGSDADERCRQRPYRDVGFRPVRHAAGDVRARIHQWLREAEQAMQLARRLPAEPIESLDAVETPRRRLPADEADPPALAPGGLSRLLTGLEWGQAVTVLASFDSGSLADMLREART